MIDQTSCNAWSGLEGAQGPGEVQAILFPWGKAMNKGRTMENHWDNYGQPLGNYGKPWTEGNTMMEQPPKAKCSDRSD